MPAVTHIYKPAKPGTFPLAVLATELGLTRNKLYKQCRELGVLGSNNIPDRRLESAGLFSHADKSIVTGGREKRYAVPYITRKGKQWLLEKLKAKLQGDCEFCGHWSGDLQDGACLPCRQRYYPKQA